MNILARLLLLAVLLILMTTLCQITARAGALAAEAADKEKLVGKWTLVKSTNRFNGVPPGCTVAFTKEGLIHVVVATGYQTHSGTYKVEKDRIIYSLNDPGSGAENKGSLTIMTLTEKDLVTKYKSGADWVFDTYKKQ